MLRRPNCPPQILNLALPIAVMIGVFTFSCFVSGQAVAKVSTTALTDDRDKKPNSDSKSPPSKAAASKSDGDKEPEKKAKKSDSDPEMDARLKALEEKLDEMQQTIQAQQATIKSMSDKLAKTDAAVSSGTNNSSASTVNSRSTAESSSQPQTVEDRVKKLEGDSLRIGPLRVSGDFRLRADGIFRSADTTPPPGFGALTHQQNVRARYRFRVNFDADLDKKFSFHGQLATGPVNNSLTNDSDFGETVVRHPLFVNEAWVDYHPTKSFDMKGGKLKEVFADDSKFMFDDDVRFNGFNESYTWNLTHPTSFLSSVEFRAGQYIFSNPNVAIVTAGSPLADAGAKVGTIGRAANLFHQGVLFNQKYNDRWSAQFGGDVQIFRNPNQIQLASTANGLVLLVQGGLGLVLSGPISGTGNATTTSGGAQYTARNFQIVRLMYRLNWAGFKVGDHAYPVVFNVQASRNVGVGIEERDAFYGAIQIGKATKRGDTGYWFIYTIKGANSMISQLTDDDIGTNSGVNIRTAAFRFELGLTKKLVFQSWVYLQKELRNSGQFPRFFVPLNGFTPLQSRFQEQLQFSF